MRKFKKYLFFLLFLICPVFALAEQIDINTAILSQLDKLTGIGPTYAQRIIDNRPYSSVDDLLRVKGVGTTTLQKIKIQSFACVNCQGMAISTSIESTTTQQEETSSTTSQAPEQTVEPSPSPVLEVTATGLPYIFISEILPSPEGADTENEFIELFNANNFTADISGFKIKDKIGAIMTFVCPMDTKIPANGSFVFKSNQTKISLNNTGDGVELLDSTGKIIDSTDFGKSQPGQSWSKLENAWAWTAKPTPGQANIIVAISANATSNLKTATSSKTNLLATNIQNYPPQHKNFLAVGIATIIALSSALIAWRIKKNSTEV